jgi:uncharacterized protein (DUF433 family)
MTETALLDLPAIEDTRSAVAEASALANGFVDKVQAAIDSALQIPHKAREKWGDLQLFAQQGNAERAAVMRGVFFYQLALCIDVMQKVQQQAVQAGVVACEPLQRIDQLAVGMADLGNLRREVHLGWPGSQPLPDSPAGTSAAPLRIDNRGDIFVGGSAVLLDTIVQEFEAGTPPEEIVRGYDTVRPADVYGAIAYYLGHKQDVEAYIQRRNREAEQLWRDIEATQPSAADLKARVKERWSRKKAANGSPAE